MSYEITEKEKNKVKLNSAFALPTSPSERGMKPEAIKTMLWKPFEVLIGIINESFQKIENADIEHSGSAEAHSDIRLLIEQLNEYVNTLSQQHDIDTNAHADIRQAIQLVHNLASGKAMVHPVADVESFLELLKRDLNEGDIIVTAKKNMPDFIVCSFTDEVERDIEFDDNSFGYGFSFDTENTGLYYVYNRRYDGAKIELLSIESGVDTSKFATKELLEEEKSNLEARLTGSLGGKLDKIEAAHSFSRLYGVSTDGKQMMFLIGPFEHNVARYTGSTDGTDEKSGYLVTHTPENDYHAANKKYVDDVASEKLAKITGNPGVVYLYAQNALGQEDKRTLGTSPTTMGNGNIAQYWSQSVETGDTNPSGCLITRTPTKNYHAANKKYVDDLVGDVSTALTEVRDIAEIARSLAIGKSKVYWVPSAQIMLYDILDVREGLNSGDVYVILEKNVPEFAVLSKNTTAFDGAVIIQDPTDEVEYKPGQVYFFAGFNLLAMENGVDTSALATKEELGDIDAALDIIIAIQNSLIGGDDE